MGALVTGIAVVTGALVLGTVVVVGATVVVIGAAVVELSTAENMPGRQNCASLKCTEGDHSPHWPGAQTTPEVVVPGGRVLFALASSTAVGLVVVGATVVVAGAAVAGATARKQECLCQQGPTSLEVAASEQRSLASGRWMPVDSLVEPCCTSLRGKAVVPTCCGRCSCAGGGLRGCSCWRPSGGRSCCIGRRVGRWS